MKLCQRDNGPFTKSFLMTLGTIFNIQRYLIYDGLGIRTTVFLKGYTLNGRNY